MLKRRHKMQNMYVNIHRGMKIHKHAAVSCLPAIATLKIFLSKMQAGNRPPETTDWY